MSLFLQIITIQLLVLTIALAYLLWRNNKALQKRNIQLAAEVARLLADPDGWVEQLARSWEKQAAQEDCNEVWASSKRVCAEELRTSARRRSGDLELHYQESLHGL